MKHFLESHVVSNKCRDNSKSYMSLITAELVRAVLLPSISENDSTLVRQSSLLPALNPNEFPELQCHSQINGNVRFRTLG